MRANHLFSIAVLSAVWQLAAPALLAQTTATESILYSPNGRDSDGSVASLIQAADGLFWGGIGGGYDVTIFSISDTANYTAVAAPPGSIGNRFTQGTDGNLYGTSAQGAYFFGTVFVTSESGSVSTLYSFCGTSCNGPGDPSGALVQGTDGGLYGTADFGQDNGGVVYKITSAGAVTILHDFCTPTDCGNGDVPSGGLIQGSDGDFYGVTGATEYGAYGGTIFKMTPTGTVTLLYIFCKGGTPCSDGETPVGPLVEDSEGSFYGIAQGGGANSKGTVFKLSASGTFSTLYNFCTAENCADGAEPQGGLTLGSDGNLYGVTESGGAELDGAVYQLSRSGTYDLLYSVPSGQAPFTPPTQDSYTGNLLESRNSIYELTLTPPIPPPVQMKLSASTITPGKPVNFTYRVLNAFSTTLQQCYGFQLLNGTVTPLGRVPGTLANGVYSGAGTITPPTYGSYIYSVTCGGQESATADLVVLTPTMISLVAAPNPVDIGQSTTLTATVSSGGTAATGTLDFLYAGQVIARATLVNGMATYTADALGVAPGSYFVKAIYSGDATHLASTSAPYMVVLAAAPTTTSLVISPYPVYEPNPVTLTATVNRSAPGSAGTPTGTVTFYSQSVAIATAGLGRSGIAVVTAPTKGIAKGLYSVTAQYNGDSNDNPSDSLAVTESVQ